MKRLPQDRNELISLRQSLVEKIGDRDRFTDSNSLSDRLTRAERAMAESARRNRPPIGPIFGIGLPRYAGSGLPTIDLTNAFTVADYQRCVGQAKADLSAAEERLAEVNRRLAEASEDDTADVDNRESVA